MSPEQDVRQERSVPDIRLPPGYAWTWSRELGAGGEGTAHLWAHLDDNRKIVERIVIRNTEFRPSQRFKDGPLKGEWIELFIQQQLVPNGCTDAYTVPVLAAAKIPGTTLGYRTYMPFFSKGDFHTVIYEHTRKRPLPEPFLWYAFHRLAIALVELDTMFRDPDKDGPVVTHNDIKPGNILMGYAGSLGRDVDYASYPPAYLGDFGFSYITSDDGWTWKYWLGRGTEGYFAPESTVGTTLLSERSPPTSKSNVFQVGATMLTAMTGSEFRPQDEEGLQYIRNAKWDQLVEDEKWSEYSEDLISLVQDCVRDEMEDRPSPQELLRMVEDFMARHADGMDRWGTLSWVKQKSSEIDGPIAADDDAHTAADTGTDTAKGEKRKAAGPPDSPPDAKRVKAQTALKRRLVYVASLIKGSRPRPKSHVDDMDFRLDPWKRLVYNRIDQTFDPDTFFDTADPGPIDYINLDPKVKYMPVIDISDDSEEDEPERPAKPESLPDPFTPGKPKKPLKGAGTLANPYMLSTPAKPTSAKPTPAKPTPAKPTEPPPPAGVLHNKELFSEHYSDFAA